MSMCSITNPKLNCYCSCCVDMCGYPSTVLNVHCISAISSTICATFQKNSQTHFRVFLDVVDSFHFTESQSYSEKELLNFLIKTPILQSTSYNFKVTSKSLVFFKQPSALVRKVLNLGLNQPDLCQVVKIRSSMQPSFLSFLELPYDLMMVHTRTKNKITASCSPVCLTAGA